MSDFYAGALSGFVQTIVGHPFDTAKILMQNNKPLNQLKLHQYYRGITYPLLSSTLINSVLFGVYDPIKVKTHNTFISGMFAGVTITPIVYIFDIFKNKRQIGKSLTWNVITQSKGFTSTLARESISFGVYFYIYESMRNDNYSVMASGAISGLANWTSTYPLDVIRNRQIVKNISFKQALSMGKLWSGYIPCASRAVVVNSVGFYIYELFR